MDQWTEAVPQYEHIRQNDFSYRKHKKQKEEDIAVCECKFDANDPESACGERCLNFLTSTECTPGYCPCGVYCRNQRFQKCEYAKTRLYKTESCGWGLLADEDIKAGQFVIEYCGEVISRKKARRRSHTYEKQGLTDAYIISLNSSESIDATKRGSLARFINHSCQPNCETRKWNALGEIRVGIFAKQDISVGTELLYNYNFEWYGGAKVRCLCGAASCSGFLGAKSRGFQENTYLWEDDDDRIQAFPTSFHSTSDSLYNSNFRCSFHPETIDICSRLSHSTEIKASQSSQGAPTKMEHQVFYDLGKDDELSSSSDTQANSQDVILKTIPLSSAQMQEEFHVVNDKTDKMYSLLGDLEKTSEKYYKLKMAAKDKNKKKNVQEQPETIYMDEEIDNSTRLEDEIGQVSFTFDHENTERSSVVCKPPTLHPQKIKDPDFDSIVRFNFHKDPKELVDAVENQFVADEAKSDVNENNSDELNVSMVEEREREVISSLKKLKNTMDYQDVYDHGNDNRLACSPESQANSQDVILKTVASFSVQMQESFHVVNGKINKTCTLLGDLEKTSEKYYTMKLAAKDENKKNVQEQPETIYKDENIDNIIGLEDGICQVSFSFAHENTERSSIVYKPPSLPPQKLKDPDFDSSVRFNFHKDTKEMAGVLENQFVADKGNSDVNENKFDELNVSMVEKREHKIISSGEELKNMKIDATDKEIKRLHQQNFPSRDPLGMDLQDAYDHGKDDELSSSSESQANSQDVILKTVAFFSAQMQEEFNVVNEKVDKTYTRLGDLEKTSNTYYTMMAAKDENIKKNVQEQLETVHKDEEINNNTGLEDKFGQVSLSFDYENSKRSSVVNKPPTLPILKVKDPDFDSFPRLNFHKNSNEMADVENQSVVDEGKSDVDENKFDELNFAIVEKRECEVISSREKLLDLKKINATDKEIERLQLQQNFPFCDQLQMDHQDANDRGKNDELASSSESQANSQDVILKTVAFFSVQVQEGFNVVNEKIDKTYACLGDLEKTSEKYYTMKMAAKDGNKKKNGQEQQERIYMNEEVDKNTGLEGEIGQVNFENKSDEWNVAMVEKREREKLKNMQEDVEILVEDHKRRKVTTSLVFPLY